MKYMSVATNEQGKKEVTGGATGAAQPRTLRRSSRTTLAAFGACLIAALFAFWNLRTWSLRITYPGDRNSGVEGIVLAETLELREGLPIYSADVADGFHASAYGPLHYLLGSRLIDPEHPGLLGFRILAASTTLGSAAACGVLAFWVSGSWLGAVLAPLIYLSFAVVSQFDVTARSDSTAPFLEREGPIHSPGEGRASQK